ncbi:hypothetical protein FRC17_008613 [Serendipita sp. 399]|nr:hypothetical protein FRC17_008613 [Serendipita sp. 399]
MVKIMCKPGASDSLNSFGQDDSTLASPATAPSSPGLSDRTRLYFWAWRQNARLPGSLALTGSSPPSRTTALEPFEAPAVEPESRIEIAAPKPHKPSTSDPKTGQRAAAKNSSTVSPAVGHIPPSGSMPPPIYYVQPPGMGYYPSQPQPNSRSSVVPIGGPPFYPAAPSTISTSSSSAVNLITNAISNAPPTPSGSKTQNSASGTPIPGSATTTSTTAGGGGGGGAGSGADNLRRPYPYGGDHDEPPKKRRVRHCAKCGSPSCKGRGGGSNCPNPCRDCGKLDCKGRSSTKPGRLCDTVTGGRD